MGTDSAHFTASASLFGAAICGVAAAMLVLLSGRIAGISGILGGLIAMRRGDIAWRLAFVAGLLAAPTAMVLMGRELAPRIDAGLGMLLVAGSLVQPAP